MRVLVTGGAGFVGSHLVEHLLVRDDVKRVVAYDALTYAGRIDRLSNALPDSRFDFVHGDICNLDLLAHVLDEQDLDTVLHLAAETHVDRSFASPELFVRTNVEGTIRVFEASRRAGVERVVHVSTDEVYGPVVEHPATEDHPMLPTNPYACSKAAGELAVAGFRAAHGMDVRVVRPANTFGPRQDAEKLIPTLITAAARNERLPLYGDGTHVRDWLFVTDHCAAIEAVLDHGEPGGYYNIAGYEARRNVDTARSVCSATGCSEALIDFVADRAVHDVRYHLDDARLRSLGWRPVVSFCEGLALTVEWFARHGIMHTQDATRVAS